eukprot:gene20310-27066_t
MHASVAYTATWSTLFKRSLYFPPAVIPFAVLIICAVIASSILPARINKRNALDLASVLDPPKVEKSSTEARRLADSLHHLKRLWSQNGKLFKEWWQDLPSEERKEFLLGICLFMPEDRSRLSAALYGNEPMQTDVVPEWNLQEMMQGEMFWDLGAWSFLSMQVPSLHSTVHMFAGMRLPRFIEEHIEFSDGGERSGAIAKLVTREVPMARQLIQHGLVKTQLDPAEHRNGFVAILPNCFGVHGIAHDSSVLPMVQQRVREGTILWSWEWEAVVRRLDLQLHMLVTSMVHFYFENLDPKGGKSFGIHTFPPRTGQVKKNVKL